MRTPPAVHEHEHTHLTIGVTHSHTHHHSPWRNGQVALDSEAHHDTRHAHAADHAGLVLPDHTHMRDGQALMADMSDIGLMIVQQLEMAVRVVEDLAPVVVGINSSLDTLAALAAGQLGALNAGAYGRCGYCAAKPESAAALIAHLADAHVGG